MRIKCNNAYKMFSTVLEIQPVLYITAIIQCLNAIVIKTPSTNILMAMLTTPNFIKKEK